MTTQQFDQLMRPYRKWEAQRRREEMLPWVLATLVLGLLAASGVLFLAMLLNS